MLNHVTRKLKPFIVASTLAIISASANATLIKSYDFNGDLTDTLGNGVSLTSSGGTVGAGRYSFAANQGLRLTSALPSTTDYGIEIAFQINDSLSGFNKILDFQDLASDIGLYELNGGIDFYTVGPSAGSVILNTDFTIGFARAGVNIEVFLNGVSLFSVADGGQAVPGANILNFFEDDFATSQGESFAGSVDYIRIHDDSTTFGTAPLISAPLSVPEPATLLLMSLGLAGLGFSGRRQAK